MADPLVVLPATPTPNGDLHVGHIAGPYLAADVFARARLREGREVVQVTCPDVNQTYVLSSARRNGEDPRELARRSNKQIRASLAAFGIDLADLPEPDEAYARTCQAFVLRLDQRGHTHRGTVTLPVDSVTGEVLYDSLVTGECPSCGATAYGGVCEDCGAPNNFDELRNAYPTLNPEHPVSHRPFEIVVLDLENFRHQLTDYYAQVTPHWRPHGADLVHDLLARRLPTVPVTIPGARGTPAPYDDLPDQVIYPWIEGIPAAFFATWHAAARPSIPVDSVWNRSTGVETVFFHGFDNVYHWALLDIVTLLAHDDDNATPTSSVINEFYQLHGVKFSTSRKHVIGARELTELVPRDLARAYLCATAPETEQTNFTLPDMTTWITERLVDPWNGLVDGVTALLVDEQVALPLSPQATQVAVERQERVGAHLQLPRFSPARATHELIEQLAQLHETAVQDLASLAPGDLVEAVARWLESASPVLVDLTATAAKNGWTPSTGLEREVPSSSLPWLPRPYAMEEAGRAEHVEAGHLG